MDMSVLQLYFRTAWNDYFPATSTTNLNSQTPTSRQTPSNTGVHVSNCLFGSISSSSAGGALYCSSTYFLVEFSSFISCKTSNYGGAIYFTNSGGQSVLYEICGYDCCSTHSNVPCYQIVYIYVKDAISSKNYINYSSISRCVSEHSNSWYTLCLCYGTILCPSVNLSLNKCYYQSIYFLPSSHSSSVTCSFTYSSFSDNILTGYTLFCLCRTGAKYEIKSCNVLRNT
jgi:hypothetical protein